MYIQNYKDFPGRSFWIKPRWSDKYIKVWLKNFNFIYISWKIILIKYFWVFRSKLYTILKLNERMGLEFALHEISSLTSSGLFNLNRHGQPLLKPSCTHVVYECVGVIIILFLAFIFERFHFQNFSVSNTLKFNQ